MGQACEAGVVRAAGNQSPPDAARAGGHGSGSELSVPSLQPLIGPILLALAASVVVMAFAAGFRAHSASMLAAAVSLAVIAAAAAYINAPLWRPVAAGAASDLLLGSLRRNARLAALTYAWGSAALFAAYGLVGLKWQHGLQYATVLALFAGGHLWFVHDMGRATSWLRTPKGQDFGRLLGVLHGIAALGALCFLILSGKLLSSPKPDWLANHVFLAGLIAIVVICALGAVTQGRFARQR